MSTALPSSKADAKRAIMGQHGVEIDYSAAILAMVTPPDARPQVKALVTENNFVKVIKVRDLAQLRAIESITQFYWAPQFKTVSKLVEYLVKQ